MNYLDACFVREITEHIDGVINLRGAAYQGQLEVKPNPNFSGHFQDGVVHALLFLWNSVKQIAVIAFLLTTVSKVAF